MYLDHTGRDSRNVRLVVGVDEHGIGRHFASVASLQEEQNISQVARLVNLSCHDDYSTVYSLHWKCFTLPVFPDTENAYFEERLIHRLAATLSPCE